MIETVKELITALEALPPDMPLLQSKDAEGNEYKPVYAVSRGAFFDAQHEPYFEAEAGEEQDGRETAVLWPA